MLKQIEGSKGAAEAVALCRPQAVCAYAQWNALAAQSR
jgi:hypothetical protein